MINTLPLDELENNAGTIYEAIVMIAKRANQINEVQRKLLEAQSDTQESETDELDDEVISEDLIERQYLKLPKPTALAINEMLEGKLRRIQDEEEQE